MRTLVLSFVRRRTEVHRRRTAPTTEAAGTFQAARAKLEQSESN